jgi:hypothetical protein
MMMKKTDDRIDEAVRGVFARMIDEVNDAGARHERTFGTVRSARERRRAFALSLAAAVMTSAAVLAVIIMPAGGRFAQAAAALPSNPQIVQYAEILASIRL